MARRRGRGRGRRRSGRRASGGGGKKRRSRNKYLGPGCASPPCVRDVGRKGLDSPREYEAILRRIVQDYRKGRISGRTARGRLLLLLRLTYPSHNRKAARISPATRRRLREEIRRALERL